MPLFWRGNMRKKLIPSTLALCLTTNAASAQIAIEQDNFPGLFCDYVAVFSEQITRNRIRNVPFSRLSKFGYFSAERAQFLREVAQQIYDTPSSTARRNLPRIGQITQQQCQRRFND